MYLCIQFETPTSISHMPKEKGEKENYFSLQTKYIS